MMYLLTFSSDISIFALNTASMIGLGLGIDFSLIVVNRFDEELEMAAGQPRGRRRDDGLRWALDRVFRRDGVRGMLLLTLLFDLLVVRSMSLAVMLVAGTGVLAGLDAAARDCSRFSGRASHWLRVLPKPRRNRAGHGVWYRFSQR